MGIAAFNRGHGNGSSESPSDSATDGGQNGEGLTAFIGQGSEFQGSLAFKNTARIDGRFNGEISAENTLIVGETADVEANIKSKNVIISGAVAGDVVATRQLIVKKTGRLKGSVQTPSLVIEQGALFNGKTKMVRPEVLAGTRGDPKPAKDAKVPEPSVKAASRPAKGAVPRGQSWRSVRPTPGA